MKSMLSKNPIVAVAVIVALAAGTMLLAGYVDKPSQGTAAAPDAKCAGCSMEGTPQCCKAAGSCQGHETDAVASPASEGTCGGSGCAQDQQQTGCSGGGCPDQTQGGCGSGGCGSGGCGGCCDKK